MTGRVFRQTSAQRRPVSPPRLLAIGIALLAALGSGNALGVVAPPEAPAALIALIGEYQSETARLTVYEQGGRLYADGTGIAQAALERKAPLRFQSIDRQALIFEQDANHHAISVTVAGVKLPRRDIGLETVMKIRAGVNGQPERLRAAALAAAPPAEPVPKRSADLVNLATVDPAIHFDIRYATNNNFVGFALYDRAEAFLQRPAAEAVGRASRTLARQGFGLLIHDAYRPWFVTKLFWDATPDYAHVFVADPAEGSRHNRGCAVDLTLYDLKSGRAVEMTGRYDEMSVRSYANYLGGTSRQRWLRDLLRSAMEAEGFTVYAEEWWHFDYKDWHDYGIGTMSFAALDGAAGKP